jgi:glycerol-3-phosphate acyltransferase PlsY
MSSLIWILIAFTAGSIPTSVWMGKLFLGLDIRNYGDGNPGATNVIRAGSPLLGVVTLLLDVCKAAIPVGICYFNLQIRGAPLVLISIAPVLGHMFSPFLKFKGGKALASTLGVWIGLTLWKASGAAVLGVVLGVLLLNTTGWAVILSMLMILASLMIFILDPLFYSTWLIITTLLAWAHRKDLAIPPRLNQKIKNILHRNEQ